LPFSYAEWEKLSIFLNLLIPKLPAPKEDDLSRGILEAIDLDSYRAEVRGNTKIALEDTEGQVEPVPTSGAGSKPEPELERLSEIIREFNDLFGNISWADEDKIRRLLFEEIPEKVLADPAYQNAIKNSDRQNARVEHDRVLRQIIASSVADHAELYKHFEEDPSFKQWLGDRIFGVTYQPPDSR